MHYKITLSLIIVTIISIVISRSISLRPYIVSSEISKNENNNAHFAHPSLNNHLIPATSRPSISHLALECKHEQFLSDLRTIDNESERFRLIFSYLTQLGDKTSVDATFFLTNPEFLTLNSDKYKSTIVNILAKQIAIRGEPEKAAAMIDISSAYANAEAAVMIGKSWGHEDPFKAKAWVTGLQEGKFKDFAFKGFISSWFKVDYSAAAAYSDSLDEGLAKDMSRLGMAIALISRKDIDSGEALRDQISDGNIRAELDQKLKTAKEQRNVTFK